MLIVEYGDSRFRLSGGARSVRVAQRFQHRFIVAELLRFYW
jgi:hypothetical protein